MSNPLDNDLRACYTPHHVTPWEGIMIVKSKGGGYQVKSHSGKALSKPGMPKAAAKKRLQQVEYFKHKKR